MRPLTDAELKKMERDTIRSATGDDGWPTDKVGWVPMLMLSSACVEIRALRASVDQLLAANRAEVERRQKAEDALDGLRRRLKAYNNEESLRAAIRNWDDSEKGT